MPFLARLKILRQWTGYCDMTPDYSPVMGLTEVDGFVVDAGWGTWGFKASPICGVTMAELIATGKTPALIEPFALERFHKDTVVPERAPPPSRTRARQPPSRPSPVSPAQPRAIQPQPGHCGTPRCALTRTSGVWPVQVGSDPTCTGLAPGVRFGRNATRHREDRTSTATSRALACQRRERSRARNGMVMPPYTWGQTRPGGVRPDLGAPDPGWSTDPGWSRLRASFSAAGRRCPPAPDSGAGARPGAPGRPRPRGLPRPVRRG